MATESWVFRADRETARGVVGNQDGLLSQPVHLGESCDQRDQS